MANHIRRGLNALVLGAAASGLTGYVFGGEDKKPEVPRAVSPEELRGEYKKVNVVYVDPEKEPGINRKAKGERYGKGDIFGKLSDLSDEDRKGCLFLIRAYRIKFEKLTDNVINNATDRLNNEEIGMSYFDGPSRDKRGGGGFTDIFGNYHPDEEIMLTARVKEKFRKSKIELKVADLDRQKFLHANPKIEKKGNELSYVFKPGTFHLGEYGLFWFVDGILRGGNPLTITERESEKKKKPEKTKIVKKEEVPKPVTPEELRKRR